MKVQIYLFILAVALLVLFSVNYYHAHKAQPPNRGQYMMSPSICDQMLKTLRNYNSYNMGDPSRIVNLGLPDSDFMKYCIGNGSVYDIRGFNNFCLIPGLDFDTRGREKAVFDFQTKTCSSYIGDMENILYKFQPTNIKTFPQIWNSITPPGNSQEYWVPRELGVKDKILEGEPYAQKERIYISSNGCPPGWKDLGLYGIQVTDAQKTAAEQLGFGTDYFGPEEGVKNARRYFIKFNLCLGDPSSIVTDKMYKLTDKDGMLQTIMLRNKNSDTFMFGTANEPVICFPIGWVKCTESNWLYSNAQLVKANEQGKLMFNSRTSDSLPENSLILYNEGNKALAQQTFGIRLVYEDYLNWSLGTAPVITEDESIYKGTTYYYIILGDNGGTFVYFQTDCGIKDAKGNIIFKGPAHLIPSYPSSTNTFNYFYEGHRSVKTMAISFENAGSCTLGEAKSETQKFDEEYYSPMQRFKMTNLVVTTYPYQGGAYIGKPTIRLSYDILECNSTKILKDYILGTDKQVRLFNDGNIIAYDVNGKKLKEVFRSNTQDGTLGKLYSSNVPYDTIQFDPQSIENKVIIIKPEDGYIHADRRSSDMDKSKLWISANGRYILYFEKGTEWDIFHLYINPFYYGYIHSAFTPKVAQDKYKLFMNYYKPDPDDNNDVDYADKRAQCLAEDNVIIKKVYKYDLPTMFINQVHKVAPCLYSGCYKNMSLTTPSVDESVPQKYYNERCSNQKFVVCAGDILNKGEIHIGGDIEFKQNCGFGNANCQKSDDCPIGELCDKGYCYAICDENIKCQDPNKTCLAGLCTQKIDQPPIHTGASNPIVTIGIIIVVLALVIIGFLIFYKG